MEWIGCFNSQPIVLYVANVLPYWGEKEIENNILSQIPFLGGKNHPKKKSKKSIQNCHMLTTGKGP